VSVWGYSVTLNDPSNLGGSNDATLVYDLQQALGFWTQYIMGSGTLTVALNIKSISSGRESGGPTQWTQVGTNGALSIVEGSAQYELATGQHLAGTSSDITINVDPRYFQYLDLDSGLNYYSDVPTNKYNPIIVFLHEIMHGLGMAGFYDQNGNITGSRESTFDGYIGAAGSGAVFTGANAEAVYGGPVPITTSVSGENYGHFGNTASDQSRTAATVQDALTLDLMNGVVLFFDYQYPVSALDLALLKDLGYTLRTKPVVTAQDVSATRSQSLAASSLFSVSAAAGDSMTAYQFWDSTPDSSSGRWRIGNPSPQMAGRAIDATAAQLSSSFFDAGKIGDQLWVRAYDGVLWSDWTSFNVNVPDQAPVVQAHDQPASHLQSFTAASLFSVTDGEGDPVTAYQFWSATNDSVSGYWLVGGVAQGAGQAIDVTPGQIASAQFQTGSGATRVWVRAYDGIAWGGWTGFNINAPPDAAPVITAPGYAANHNQNIAATSVFSVSDADNDTITAYQFWDSTFGSTSGYWLVNGVVQAAGQAINVTPSQLANASFQSASGTDQLWVRASDGLRWSDWTSFNVTAPAENAPVITAHTYSATHFENIAAASLFSVSDADGDPITAYQFWDSTFDPASGRWIVGGSVQPVGQAINVTAAQFATATFQTGSGPDQLWVRATDGALWSDWTSVSVIAPIDHAPVATTHDFNATHFQNIAAGSLFSVSDADGDPMVAYQLWDSTPDASSGQWMVGGVVQAPGRAINMTAAQFASTTFQSGSTGDLLWVRASDGTLWSDWSSFIVNVPGNQSPVVTAPGYNATHFQNIAAASLFSVSDADGDAMVAYQFWDSTPDALSGHWVVGGVAQPAGQAITVSASQLASTTFQSGSGGDQLWVRTSDGSLWSDWQSFNVNAPVDHGPMVSAPDYAATHAQNIAATDLFAVSDVDGDAITGYWLTVLTASVTSGHWVVAGLAQPAAQTVHVTAGQFASLTFQTGLTSDLVSVTASDGTVGSSQKLFYINVPADIAPVVTASNYAATHLQNIAAVSLFSASDADGDAITAYQFWEAPTGAGSGSWIVGGTTQPVSEAIDVTPAQIATASFRTGTITDQLRVRASDGDLWSDWVTFNVTPPPDIAPVVSATDYTATQGQTIAAASLFSVSDADGDAITAYQFWDVTTDATSGYWTIGSVTQTSGQPFDVTPAQFSIAAFHAGSWADEIKVRASDGITWSDWRDFYVNQPTEHPPLLSVHDVSLQVGTRLALSSFISATDPDGDKIAGFELLEAPVPAGAAYGYIKFDGYVAFGLGEDGNFDAFSWPNGYFYAAAAPTTNQLSIRAVDGHLHSDWMTINITTHA